MFTVTIVFSSVKKIVFNFHFHMLNILVLHKCINCSFFFILHLFQKYRSKYSAMFLLFCWYNHNCHENSPVLHPKSWKSITYFYTKWHLVTKEMHFTALKQLCWKKKQSYRIFIIMKFVDKQNTKCLRPITFTYDEWMPR